MPTTRQRHYVTESDQLSEALDEEAARWPDHSRAQVLVELALEGHAAAKSSREERRARRLAALHKYSGALTGVYRPDELDRLREDWPE